MAVTVASFKASRPEFQLAADSAVAAALQYASVKVPESVWGAYRDEGIELTAAKDLALSPFARELKMTNPDGSTNYDARLDELKSIVASGITRV